MGRSEKESINQYKDLYEAMLKWIRGIKDQNLPLSGPINLEEALEYASSLGHYEFQDSISWLEKNEEETRIIPENCLS